MYFFSFIVAAGTAALALAGPIAERYGSGPFLNAIAKRNGSRTFKYFGINEAGAEFGPQSLPGLLGKDYIWPSKSSIDVSVDSTESLSSVLTAFQDFGWPWPQYIPCPVLDGAIDPWMHDWTC